MQDFFIPYLFVALIFIVIWVLYRIITLRKAKSNILRETTLTIFFVYFLAVVYFTFFKNGRLAVSLNQTRYMNIIPLKETIKMFNDNFMGIRNSLYNVVGNMLLFVPLGFFIPLLFKRCNNVRKILLYGFAASLTIEIIQYFTAMNICDVDDVIFNTLGALLGIGCYRIFYRIIKLMGLEKLIDNIEDKEQGNLIKLAIKPLSVMFIACFIFTLSTVYLNTYSSKLTNKELAVKAFSRYDQGKYVACKEFDKYKFFLMDKGDYIELCQLEKALSSRYAGGQGGFQSHLNNNKFGYSVQLIGDYSKNSLTTIVFGKNNASESISITLKGKEYIEKLEANKYFIIIYPKYEKLKKNTDIDNVYKNVESKDLKIKFTDIDGKVDNDMVFCR